MDFGLDGNEFDSDDSFFEDPKIKKASKKVVEKPPLEDLFGVQDDKKSSLEDVSSAKQKVRFNFDEASDNTKTKTPDWLDAPSSKQPAKTDILDDLLAKTPPKTDDKKPFDLLDDILPQRGRKTSQPKAASFEDILKESKAQRSGPSSLEKQPAEISLSTTKKANVSEGSLNMILEPPQGGRRGRRGSNVGVTDVLGLFGSGPPSSEYLGSSKVGTAEEGRSKSSTHAPDWLGGISTTSTNKSETTISLPKTERKDQETNLPPKPAPIPDPPSKTIETHPEPAATSSFQTNMSNLQAQESFLLVSLQMKKYEENLSEIKNQQQEILKKQETQCDLFLKKYVDMQKDIEQEMLAQQQRINDHIRIMAIKGVADEPKMSPIVEDDGKESPLDKIVQSLKQRHNEEFFLMEESYRKQIALLEKSSEQLEQRLNQDIESIAKAHDDKLEALKRQHQEEINYWNGKINVIETKHKEDLENIKENQARLLREVKDEFLDQLERFKEQRAREAELFGNSAEYAQKLNFTLENLQRNESKLEHIQQKVTGDYNVLSVAREKSIETKEKDIIAMRTALEKCREQAEKDRSQLLALVGTLELKLSEQTHNAQEERWALQQAAATLAARSAAFDREVEFSRASTEREREQLKTLKEALLAEQERATAKLTEDKLKLSAEESRLEVSAKLVSNYEVEKVKTEAETAIQVAKELMEKLNVERNFVQRHKMELESFRNKLAERERGLLEREEGLEELKRTVQQKSLEDKRMIQEAKYLENRYKEKLSELQTQALSLNSREKKLAEEKLLVSKERLALYTSMKAPSNNQKKCMLCKAEEEKVFKSDAQFLGYSATDSDFMRLRVEAMEDEKNSEVSREESSQHTFHNSDIKL